MWQEALDSLRVFCIYSMYKCSQKHMIFIMTQSLVTAKYQSDNSLEHMHSDIDESKVSKWAAANSSKSNLRNQAGRKGTPMADMIRGKGGCEKNGISEHHKQEIGMIPLWPFFSLVYAATCTLFARWWRVECVIVRGWPFVSSFPLIFLLALSPLCFCSTFLFLLPFPVLILVV